MRVASYCRVSREEQATGYSLDAQQEAIDSYVQSQGWAITGRYVEPGFTARVIDRPVFNELLEACEQGQYDILITHKLDRGFRSLVDLLQTLEQLHEQDVAYISVVERIDYSTPVGKLFLSMLGAFNQFYSDNLSTEIQKGKRGRAKAGKSNAPVLPYGYTRDGDRNEVQIPEQAEVALQIFRDYSSGSLSMGQIARDLNDRGVPSASGRPWAWWTIRAILTNAYYKGDIVYLDEVYAGQHQHIVDPGLWQIAQDTMEQRKHMGRQPAQHHYLLHSLAHCAGCGTRLWVQSSQHHVYLFDPIGQRGEICQYKRKTVQMRLIDDQVTEIITRLRLPCDWQDRIEEMVNDEQPDTIVLRANLAAKLRRLQEVYIDGGISREEYHVRRQDLQSRLAQVAREPQSITVDPDMVEGLAYAWQHADIETRHSILVTMFQAIYINLDTATIERLVPHPQFRALLQLAGMEERNEYFTASGTTTATDRQDDQEECCSETHQSHRI